MRKDLDEAERWYLASAQRGYEKAAEGLRAVIGEKDAARPKKSQL